MPARLKINKWDRYRNLRIVKQMKKERLMQPILDQIYCNKDDDRVKIVEKNWWRELSDYYCYKNKIYRFKED